MNKQKHGFTVVEVLIVLAIVGVLVATFCAHFTSHGKVSSCVDQGELIETNWSVGGPPKVQLFVESGVATNVVSGPATMHVEVSAVPADAEELHQFVQQMPDTALKANSLIAFGAHYGGDDERLGQLLVPFALEEVSKLKAEQSAIQSRFSSSETNQDQDGVSARAYLQRHAL